MGRIIGRIILLLITWSMCADVKLRMTDLDGNPLSRAQAGRPFRIEIVASDVDNVGPAPSIRGLNAFTIGQTGMQIYSVNGNQTVKYFFDVRANEVGTYTVGPAEYAQPKMQSNVLQVVVDQAEVAEAPVKTSQLSRKKRDGQESIFMQLSADKKEAMVGERIVCTLRFYSADAKVGIRNLLSQETKDFKT